MGLYSAYPFNYLVGRGFGFLYETDLSFCSTYYMGIACLLVGLNLLGELEDSIENQRGDVVIHQKVDYEGIPLKCRRLHSHGQFVKDFKQVERCNIWVKKSRVDVEVVPAPKGSPLPKKL
jgi:hypothetical protein